MMDECDVLVIGGGPAGSTAAALLAQAGRDVMLLERDAHPRFHIGESLLPRNSAIFERLGVMDQVHGMGVFKPGAEFVSDRCGRSAAFPFSLALNPRYKHSYQVRRAEFDQMLFANARTRGARAHERARVIEVEPGRPGTRGRVHVQQNGATRVIAPRFVLDASGRDTLMTSKLRLKNSDKRNNTAAVFAHFRGVAPRPETAGYITVHLAEDGWFWSIPLPDGITSIGFVGDPAAFKVAGEDKAALFHRRLRESPSLHARMHGAERVSEIHATGNYSYRARTNWGEGWMAIGDAFAFLDPVFSSGVLLAMNAGEMGADVAGAWLDDRRAGQRVAKRAEARIRREMDGIGWLIHRINDPVLRSMFLNPVNRFRMRDGLISMLGGNLHGSLRARLPVMVFKSVFHTLSAARRLGVEVGRPVRAAGGLAI